MQIKALCSTHYWIFRSECHVEIDEEKATLIRKIFREVAEGVEKPNCIRKRLCPQIGSTAFFKLLRNKFYIGKIKVPAYEDEPESRFIPSEVSLLSGLWI